MLPKGGHEHRLVGVGAADRGNTGVVGGGAPREPGPFGEVVEAVGFV